MPIYVYECTECGLHFEQQQHISDDPIQVCPECAGQVQRLIQPVRVIFKGSGFYVTDNRRSTVGSSSGNHKSSSNGKSDQTKSETSKTAEKTSSKESVSTDSAS